MQETGDLKGRVWRLPDGQKVIVDSLEDASAMVRRIGGKRAGTLAVCLISKLEPYRLPKNQLAQKVTRLPKKVASEPDLLGKARSIRSPE